MVLRLPVLILLTVEMFLLSSVSWGAAKGCRGCHPAHYSGRGSCISCHGGDDRTERKRIAHYRLTPARYALFTLPGSDVVKRGRVLLERFGCRRCHTAEREGTNLAASLDRLGRKAPVELVSAMDRPAIHMPQFRFAPAEVDALVNYLLWLGPGSGTGGKESPVVVHFVRKGGEREHPFVKRCGGCHKALTESLGGMGVGSVGPNLSALFTPFYPRPHHAGEPWTPQRLKEWLENPRKIRPLAVMPPVVLEEREADRIIELLQVESRR